MACPEVMSTYEIKDLTTPELRKCYEDYMGVKLTPEQTAMAVAAATQQDTAKVALDPNSPWWSSIFSVAKTGMDVYAQQQLIEAVQKGKKTGQKILVDKRLITQAKELPTAPRGTKWWIVGGLIGLAVVGLILLTPKRK